jgi:DNA-binding winged helix-turn-helix (wHTH) protein
MVRQALGILAFGPFRLDRSSHKLTVCCADEASRPINLRAKAFDVLRYLVENAGRTIPTDEFLSQLWPRTYVQPEVLKGHVLAVRTALDDRIAPSHYIETVRGRGYRFIAEVRSVFASVSPNPHRDGSTNLVGRAESQSEFDVAMAQAVAGEAQIVFVTGDAGIGKTALSERLAKSVSATGAAVAVGHCLPGSGATDPYYPVLEMLTGGFGVDRDKLRELLTRLAPTWLIQLPAMVLPGGSEKLRMDMFDVTPHRMARELCDLLDALARTRPLLIILEDIQWADRATLDMIEALARRKLQAKLMVLATLRSHAASDDGPSAGAMAQKLSLYRLAREIKLVPLSLGEVEAYLGNLSGSAAPTKLSRHLHRRSEGNPLFMQAILDQLFQRKTVALTDGDWRLEGDFNPDELRAPPSLAQIIEAEIGNLSHDGQSVLEAGSIYEGPFSPFIAHVASSFDEETFEAVCERLCRRGQLIRRGDIVKLPSGQAAQTYRFSHALFREAVLDRQGAVHRSSAHLAIARHLAQVHANDLAVVAPSLAGHYLEAGDWMEAIRFLRLSSRTAMQRFAHREAALLLERALDASRNLAIQTSDETQLGVLEELGRIYLGMFDYRTGETYDRLSQLARKLGNVEVEARALCGLGYVVSWEKGGQCLAIFSQALEKSADIVDPVQRARVRCKAHGWRNWIQGWNADDAEGLDVALTLLKQLDDPIALHASLVDHSLVLFPAARYLEAIEDITRGFEFLVAHGQEPDVDISLPLWMARLGIPWAKMSAGLLGEAFTDFTIGFATFEANGEFARSATLRMYLAFFQERLHDYKAAIATLDEVEALLAKSGARLDPSEAMIAVVVRGLAELGLGNTAVALGQFTEAEAEMAERYTLTNWYWRLALAWGKTEALLATGDLEGAALSGERFLENACAIEERSWRGFAAEACARVALAQGDNQQAREKLTQAWAEIDGYLTPLMRWRLHAVEVHLAEEITGDYQAADYHRQSWASEMTGLVATLPDRHPGRATLLSARPLIPNLAKAGAAPVKLRVAWTR